ncbi:MAG: isochorismatase family protein, partial [Opitutaceae bacterium]
MSLPPIDTATTALVLIDLQNGIAGLPTAPHSGPDVVRNCARLADRFRERGGLVILVRVAFAPDRKDALS